MTYEVEESDSVVAGVFTYDIPDLHHTLSVMFSHHVGNPGKFNVELYADSDWEKKMSKAGLYCEMENNAFHADNKRHDKSWGSDPEVKAYVLMTKDNSPTLEIDIATSASSE